MMHEHITGECYSPGLYSCIMMTLLGCINSVGSFSTVKLHARAALYLHEHYAALKGLNLQKAAPGDRCFLGPNSFCLRFLRFVVRIVEMILNHRELGSR